MSDAGRKHSLAVMSSSASVEWYTPSHVIELARTVLGAIDLDPASCAVANETVGAARYYSQPDDGLLLYWSGRVWLNPPFGAAIDPWIERLADQYRSGYITAAIALVPARVDTGWWRRLRDYPVCFVRGRLSYSNAGGPAPFATALIYLGPQVDRFCTVFSALGDVYQRVAGISPLPTQMLLGMEVTNG